MGVKPTYRKYKFYLTEPDYGTFELDFAPDGWADEFTIERHQTFKGLLRKYSENTLQFIRDGRYYLKQWYEGKGMNANITFVVERIKNDWTYEEVFSGKVMVKTMRFTKDECEVQIEDITGLSLLNARKDMDVDLNALETLAGTSLAANVDRLIFPEQTFHDVAIWELLAANYPSVSNVMLYSLLTSDFSEAQTPNPVGTTDEQCIFLNAVQNYTSVMLVGSVTYEFDYEYNYKPVIEIVVQPSGETVQIQLDWVNGTTSFSEELTTVTTGSDITISITFPSAPAVYDFDIIGGELTLQTEEGTIYAERDVRGMGIYNAFERCVKIISELGFDSDYFDKTTGKLACITTGANIRGYVKGISTNLMDLFKSVQVLEDVALGYEGGKIIVEPLSYFFTNSVGFDISDRVTEGDIEIEFLTDFFNSIEIGFSKFTEESDNGLIEFNTKAVYSCPIEFDQKKELICPYRADTTGIVKLRANPLSALPQGDISGDDDIFIMSCYDLTGDDYTVRENEDYDTAPLGWYNLDYSPARVIRRHQIRQYIGGNDLKLQKREKGANIVSQETGGEVIDENADVPFASMATPLFRPELLTVRTYMTRAEVEALNWKEKIKLSDIYEGYIQKLTYNYKDNNVVELQILRAW